MRLAPSWGLYAAIPAGGRPFALGPAEEMAISSLGTAGEQWTRTAHPEACDTACTSCRCRSGRDHCARFSRSSSAAPWWAGASRPATRSLLTLFEPGAKAIRLGWAAQGRMNGRARVLTSVRGTDPRALWRGVWSPLPRCSNSTSRIPRNVACAHAVSLTTAMQYRHVFTWSGARKAKEEVTPLPAGQVRREPVSKRT